MSICVPTEKEILLHQRAIEKLRTQLFRKYTASDYGMVDGSLVVVPPSIYTYGACRRLFLGGLRFLIGHGDAALARLTLEHLQERFFDVHLYMLGAGQPYTRLAYSTDFARLDDEALRCARVGLWGG